MKSAGICMGASGISLALIEKNNGKVTILEKLSQPHNGNVKQKFKEIYDKYNLYSYNNIAVTGRKFRYFSNLPSISEPEAVEHAFNYLKDKYKDVNAIVSAGGETFMLYELDSNGRISGVQTGNKCASGTGEFYVQQLKRMNLSIEQVTHMKKTEPYEVSGRCSVFCKSDCTHALNKGESKERIISGLCKMMAAKIVELTKKSNCKRILLTGGTSKNSLMVSFLQKHFPDLKTAEEATFFEALGTALWAVNNPAAKNNANKLFKTGKSSFSFLPPLNTFSDKVTFNTVERGSAKAKDTCIAGIDVGSTTTKAVIIRSSDNSILACEYLRTNGDPVSAARKCYKSLYKQLNVPVDIIGLGVTGSGRQIAGLHALTDGVINEIIAHAAAAVYFDPEVDTIFEIGGQDAKYTYITNGVASDYAMNEACSAGTGSFLEESAKESMGIEMTQIADIALKGKFPPNFSDQCAAFIGSDIKTAIQEGLNTSDITAGLVYSICQNYVNRVKGNRPAGQKIFMQGGVCYNKAVPLAMAYLTGRKIVVPPEPGLMGAFGVALEIKNKIHSGLMEEKHFSLDELSKRDVIYRKSFTCSGGKEHCDRKCTINVIEINGNKYLFGGACNKYVNVLRNKNHDIAKLDFVTLREKLVFKENNAFCNNNDSAPRIGINRSLMTNTLYPLYYNFFSSLGMEVVLPDETDNNGIDKKGAAFCYPVELAHGYMADLLKKNIDYVFLPQIRELNITEINNVSVTCPFVQGEPYYLKSTFDQLRKIKVISPVIDFTKNIDHVSKIFAGIGQNLGFSKNQSYKAFRYAYSQYKECYRKMKLTGQKILNEIEDSNEIGIVLFGRSYNAFTRKANMGIPRKFASRGYRIIPMDFLDTTSEKLEKSMYWTSGQMIMQAAGYVYKHPRLFGVYITNFSCGPDSFITGYFRNIMKQKPSLILELDSHTADAGIDTRIEAFLDVIGDGSLSHFNKSILANTSKNTFKPAKTLIEDGNLQVIDSNGSKYSLTDERIHVLLPSMGDLGSRCLAAAFRFAGVNATCLNPPGETELKTGRANSNCKECLPLMLTVGGLLNYIDNRKRKDELLVYFMPDTTGPCRFGQYNVLIRNIIKQKKLRNIALISLNSANSYCGLNIPFQLRAWMSVIISDVMDDIYSALLVLAIDRDKALETYNMVKNELVRAIENENRSGLKKVLYNCAEKLSRIPKKDNINNIAKIGLLGEIYVRRDHFSCQNMVQRFADKGIAVKTAPVSEWLYYCDYLQIKKLLHGKTDWKVRLRTIFSSVFKTNIEKTIKKILSGSGLYEYHIIDIDNIITSIDHLISPKLTGEAILTIGGALTEIVNEVSGIIAVGPFGCMPNRIAESIISKTINTEKVKCPGCNNLIHKVLKTHPSLPFLPIETDGNVFPQVIEARFEAFCLQVERLHGTMQELESVSNS